MMFSSSSFKCFDSAESKHLKEELENIINSRRDKQDENQIRDDREYAMPLYTQIVAATKRAFVAYWRLPDYISVSSFQSNLSHDPLLNSF